MCRQRLRWLDLGLAPSEFNLMRIDEGDDWSWVGRAVWGNFSSSRKYKKPQFRAKVSVKKAIDPGQMFSPLAKGLDRDRYD